MLSLKFIRENPETVRKAIKSRGEVVDLDLILSLDERWRKILQENNDLRHKKNIVSRQIARIKKEGGSSEELISQIQEVVSQIKNYDDELRNIESRIDELLLFIPNIPHPTVPVGPDPSCNKIVREWGEPPEVDFPLKDHLELGYSLGIIDFKRGAKISGSGFPLYMDKGARLERSLINFMLDLHTKRHGYTEVFPPFMATRESTRSTGQLPKLEADMYICEIDDLFLIPTAEVPVTNIHKGEILEERSLPVNYAAYSACFRREAGSYGKETKGFLRVHQFNKVELVKFVKPEDSYEALERILKDAEEVLKLLALPYRVVELCTGDLGFAAAKCYDIEVWAAAEKKYLEVSSCSNFEDFQARRANIRFRRERDGKVEFVHTLNGSGVATARLMVALLEYYQTDEGTVMIPEVLQPYMGCSVIK